MSPDYSDLSVESYEGSTKDSSNNPIAEECKSPLFNFSTDHSESDNEFTDEKELLPNCFKVSVDRDNDFTDVDNTSRNSVCADLLKIFHPGYNSPVYIPRNFPDFSVEHSVSVINKESSEEEIEELVLSNETEDLTASINDSGIEVDNPPKKYKKPPHPCIFCKKIKTQSKRHILTKHMQHPSVAPLLKMSSKEQDRLIADFRRQGIKDHNVAIVNSGGNDFLRERKSINGNELPFMCTGCKGFFAISYKPRHQLICPANGSNLMLPMVSIEKEENFEHIPDDFKSLLNKLHGEVGDYIKTDKILLMIGYRSFGALKRKKDKMTEAQKTVRGRMRLAARVYLEFRKEYEDQSDVILSEKLNNAADMYRRETISILGGAVNNLTERLSSSCWISTAAHYREEVKSNSQGKGFRRSKRSQSCFTRYPKRSKAKGPRCHYCFIEGNLLILSVLNEL